MKVEWSSELLDRMKQFRDETGIQYEQMKKAGDDTVSYSDDMIADLAKHGYTEDENRKELLRDSMESLTSDESREAVVKLQERVGFTPAQITDIVGQTFSSAGELVQALADDHRIREMELITTVGGVTTDTLTEAIANVDAESRVEMASGEALPNMSASLFPSADWEKYYDDELYKRELDDSEMLEVLGEPKKNFADRVRDEQSDDRTR